MVFAWPVSRSGRIDSSRKSRIAWGSCLSFIMFLRSSLMLISRAYMNSASAFSSVGSRYSKFSRYASIASTSAAS